jgi:DNA polymerase elongation subunit (family B)
MRHIHLDDGLRLRFPGRTEEFDQGVEIGMLAVLMDQGMREFTRWIARTNVDQVRAIARQLNYHVVEGDGDGEWVSLSFRQEGAKPALTLVHSVG